MKPILTIVLLVLVCSAANAQTYAELEAACLAQRNLALAARTGCQNTANDCTTQMNATQAASVNATEFRAGCSPENQILGDILLSIAGEDRMYGIIDRQEAIAVQADAEVMWEDAERARKRGFFSLATSRYYVAMFAFDSCRQHDFADAFANLALSIQMYGYAHDFYATHQMDPGPSVPPPIPPMMP